MPEYLAPGVYVEEVSYRAKSIEGVSTTTTGLVGPTRYGPVDLPLDVITGLGEFERIYGDRQQMQFGGAGQPTTGCGMPCAPSSRRAASGSTSRASSSRWKSNQWQPQPGRQGARLDRQRRSSHRYPRPFPGRGGKHARTLHALVGDNVLTTDPPPGGTASPAVRGVLENDVVILIT